MKTSAKTTSTPKSPTTKPTLHPHNRHRGRYDFPSLVLAVPELAGFVAKNAYSDESIDFFNPAAVKLLNRALLQSVYGVQDGKDRDSRLVLTGWAESRLVVYST